MERRFRRARAAAWRPRGRAGGGLAPPALSWIRRLAVAIVVSGVVPGGLVVAGRFVVARPSSYRLVLPARAARRARRRVLRRRARRGRRPGGPGPPLPAVEPSAQRGSTASPPRAEFLVVVWVAVIVPLPVATWGQPTRARGTGPLLSHGAPPGKGSDRAERRETHYRTPAVLSEPAETRAMRGQCGQTIWLLGVTGRAQRADPRRMPTAPPIPAKVTSRISPRLAWPGASRS